MWIVPLLSLAVSTPTPPCELVRTDVRAAPAVYGAAAASDGASVYFAGGDSPRELVDDVWRYTPGTRGLSKLRKVGITPRRYAGAAFYDGALVVVGGSDGSAALALVEAVDVGAERLTRWPDLPTPRAFPGVAVFQGALWVAGGELGGRATSAVEVYDAKTKSWKKGPPLGVARATRLVVMDGALWALPGYDGKDAVAVLEKLEGDAWVKKDAAIALSAFGASDVAGGALLFGDYRTQEGVWFLSNDGALSLTQTTQVKRRHAAAATANGQVVVFGGNRTSKNASSVGVLEAFEARCAPAPDAESCDALRARGNALLRDKNTAEGRALLERAAARCGVGGLDWEAIAISYSPNPATTSAHDRLAAARALVRELERPAAHPGALKHALRLSAEPSAEVDALFFALGRTKATAISVGGVPGQRAWVQRFACPERAAPADVKQALTFDQLDRWSFSCGGAPGELWFDFETKPVAAFLDKADRSPAP